MKARKSDKKKGDNLDDIINAGKAKVEEDKPKVGRPVSSVPKKQCIFYLPENLIDVIKENCHGNRSVFAENVFKEYFDKNEIDYK